MIDNDDFQIPFYDLPLSVYPFSIAARDIDTREILWEQTVEGPGAVIVPGKPDGVREVIIEIGWGDGTTSVAE